MDANRGFSKVRRVHAKEMGRVAATVVVHKRSTHTPHFLFNSVLHELQELDQDVDKRLDFDWHREARILASFIVGDVRNWQMFLDNEAQIAIHCFFESENAVTAKLE